MNYIQGQWQKGSGEPFHSVNPADGSMVWQGQLSSVEDVHDACVSAHLALSFWSSQDFASRCHYIHNFTKEIEARKEELAYLISLESGKPLWESLSEVHSVIGKGNLSIQAYQERNAEKVTQTPDATACLRYKPHGVVAVLGAFNFPAHLSNGHIIPALLAGNTVVYKPSELTPAVAQFIMQCWHESGLPKGVINCVQGDASTGEALLASDIQGVYFTGSYQSGKRIHQAFSQRPEVILALEMGGDNPLLIGQTKQIKAAVYYSILSTMITAGQRCTCARRMFIPRNSWGDQFLTQFISACNALKIGSFNEKPEPFMGPVIRFEHAQKHLNAQKNLLKIGGIPLLSMSSLKKDSGFLSPGVIDMSETTSHFDEEIFAPLVQIYRYQDFSEALILANQTRYGLAAGLISEEKEEYQLFYRTIRAGLINWNRPTTGAIGSLPFGGVGCSGNNRPSAYFAADYCSYPIASLEQDRVMAPDILLPGIHLD